MVVAACSRRHRYRLVTRAVSVLNSAQVSGLTGRFLSMQECEKGSTLPFQKILKPSYIGVPKPKEKWNGVVSFNDILM